MFIEDLLFSILIGRIGSQLFSILMTGGVIFC